MTRYAPRLALAYDVDAAGQGAATFGATELSALVGEIERSAHKGRLTDVGVVRLPDNRDPDEVMREDPEAWRTATADPQPIVEYLIDVSAKRHDPRTLAGREKLVAAVMPTIRRVTNPTQRDGYLQQLARRSGVDDRVLLEELRRPEEVARVVGRPSETHVGSKINLEAVLSSPDALDPEAVARTLEPVESALLRVVLLRPYVRDSLGDRISAELFVTTPARELWRRIEATPVSGFDRAAFVESLDPTLAAIARTLFARTDPLPEDDDALNQSVEQSLLSLERNRIGERLEFVRAELSEAEANDDTGASDRLRREVLELQTQRLRLDRKREDTTVLSQRRNKTPATTAVTP